jgi:uncharacterized repeat protein (TIGR03987 family)
LPTIILLSVISICAALVFYTIAVWANFASKRLKPWHFGLFVAGLTTDVLATSGMAASVNGEMRWDFHTISGYTALFLMTITTLAGAWAVLKKNDQVLANFHRFAVPVWCVWMVSWTTGVVLGLQKY